MSTEYKYPMWFKHIMDGMVVRFDGLCSGTVVVNSRIYKIGGYSKSWVSHNNDVIWKDVTDQYKPTIHEAPKCQHEISFNDECEECNKLNKEFNSNKHKEHLLKCWEENNKCVMVDVPFSISERPKVKHYQDGGIEPIDYINSHNFNFNIGNCIKYCSRAGLKGDAIEDLQKAIHYLQFEIQRLENVQK